MTLTADELLRDADRIEEALNDAKPTAKAILYVSYIEQALATLLRAFFIQGSTGADILHHSKGVLKELSARNKIAYGLGLIDEAMHKNINTLGSIRNAFAHSHLGKTFDDKDISDLCNQLTLPII